MTEAERKHLNEILRTRLPGEPVRDRRSEPEPERERARTRSLTDAEAQRWHRHLQTSLACERNATAAAIEAASEANQALVVEAMQSMNRVIEAIEGAQERAVAGLRRELEAARKDIAVLQKSNETLRKVIAKRIVLDNKGAVTDLPNPLPRTTHVAGHA
jgi:hypothetical protein